MNLERTLSIIKPDILKKNYIGKIIDRFEKNGLKIIELRMLKLNEKLVKDFYSIHRDKPFFSDLIKFMISGPVVVQVLEGKNAVLKNRFIMGDTNPSKAKKGTIRSDFSISIDENSVHGSDSLESAKKEINFFFKSYDI